MNKKAVYPIFVIIVFLFFYFFAFQPKTASNVVVFCNVGQGDGILIKSGDQEVLVDAGKNDNAMMDCLSKYLSPNDRVIEKVIASHYDSDHIGGFAQIFANYEVEVAYGLGLKAGKDTETYKNWLNNINTEGISEQVLTSGMNLNFSGGNIEVLYPNYDTDYSSTNLSDVLKLHFLGKTFLFTGDLELPDWQILENDHTNLEADILKVAHHGSKNGTDQKVIDAVSPRETIISVGKNSYGHPAELVLELFANSRINIKRTDQNGDVVYE
jgi:beta-lactamase superfamily II metal-dependent hydrolase